MSDEEVNSIHKYTVCEYHVLHKWDTGCTPSQTMEFQEMGLDGQDNRETGGSDSDRTFFMNSAVSPSSVGVDTDMTGEKTSEVTEFNFPHITPRKDVVFNYYTLVSDDLINSGPNSLVSWNTKTFFSSIFFSKNLKNMI